MIVFLLLVIIAIMLFGSSAIVGAFGVLGGFIALILALFFGSYLLALAIGITVDELFRYGLPTLLAFLVMGPLIMAIAKEFGKAAVDFRQRKIARIREAALVKRRELFRLPAPNKADKKAKRQLGGW